MSYYAGFSALGLGSEHMDSELITIIESPENPVQIGYATPMGEVSDDGLEPYILCLFGDRRPVAGDWFLKDGRFCDRRVVRSLPELRSRGDRYFSSSGGWRWLAIPGRPGPRDFSSREGGVRPQPCDLPTRLEGQTCGKHPVG